MLFLVFGFSAKNVKMITNKVPEVAGPNTIHCAPKLEAIIWYSFICMWG